MKHIAFLYLIISALFFTSCGDSEQAVPKPPSYLRIEMPEHSYAWYEPDCPYRFKLSEAYQVRDVRDPDGALTCHKDISLGKLNGVMHFSYIKMQEPLAAYVNFSNDKVDEHQIKATAIRDKQIIRPEARVYGTFFELQGDVASPFQFYLTDSTENFASGVVYFNSVPNYDSLKPSLDYLKEDLEELLNSFEWKK